MAVQYDERGRPFIDSPTAGRVYIGPGAFATAAPGTRDRTFADENQRPNDGNFFRNQSRWNVETGEYESGGVNWGNVLSLAAAGTIAAPLVAPLVAGGAASAAPAAASAPAAAGAGATAAGAGTATATSAGSGIVGGALRYGAPIVGNLIDRTMANRANRDAAELEAQAAREALAYEKERDTYARSRYEQYANGLQPWVDTGRAANQASAAALAGSRYQPATAAPQAPVSLEPKPGSLVALRAPNGAMKSVPAEQVEHYVSRGAVRV